MQVGSDWRLSNRVNVQEAKNQVTLELDDKMSDE